MIIFLQLAGVRSLLVVKEVHSFRIRIEVLWPCFWLLAFAETFERVSTTVTLGPCHVPAFHSTADEKKNKNLAFPWLPLELKMHQNFPLQKGEWQQKEAMTTCDSMSSGCLSEMYHITPMYETTSPSHACTNVLTITYTYHHPHLWCTQNNGAALTMNSTVADDGSSTASAHLFYDLL